ncbi:MAG: hypothetical protein ACTHNS_04715 [Marmoricola sp.]
MKLIVVAVVVIAVAAVVWWSSGRSTPMLNREGGTADDPGVGAAKAQRYFRDMGGQGPTGPGVGGGF